MDNSELIAELLQALSKDVAGLKAKVEKLPTQAPTDYKTTLEGLTKTVEQLQQTVQGVSNWAKQASSSPDQSLLKAQLDRIEFNSRQHPDRKASQYVQVGAYASGLLVVLLAVLTWYGLDWKRERDDYARSYTIADWRLRYLKQADPEYYQVIQGKFNQDADATGRWIEEQEQADATREAARQAAEQAAALTKQADRLERKKPQAQ